jgi:transposase InsO family protein
LARLLSSIAFKHCCRDQRIRQRFGAVGKPGSIAVVERFIRTWKEYLFTLPIRSLSRRNFRDEITIFISWYNTDRPHTTLKGATPDEVYFRHRPANRLPRFEPRAGWPRASPGASPRTLVKGQPGVRLQMSVEFASRSRHLPRITITRAA